MSEPMGEGVVHTKGPLVVKGEPGLFRVYEPHGEFVAARVYRRADAHLYAAAPEMLDCLESQKADLQLLAMAIEAGDPLPELRVRVKDMIASANAMIAKAQPND